MPIRDNIQKLKDARDKIIAVYKDEATDDKPDNGNLTVMNSVILGLNETITNIEKRDGKGE